MEGEDAGAGVGVQEEEDGLLTYVPWRDSSIHIPGSLFLFCHMQIHLKPNTEHELSSLVAAEMMLRGRPDQESRVVSD